MGVAFETSGRFSAAINRYMESQEAYSKLADDKQRVLRMRECVIKARHVLRELIKMVGGANSEGELPTPVRMAYRFLNSVPSVALLLASAAYGFRLINVL